MKAMILAAGRGERMRPLTDSTPKPLLSVNGQPLIEYHIEKLAAAGITDIVINLAWLGGKIETQLGNGDRWQVKLHYSDEREDGALETAGGIKKALKLLKSAFFSDTNKVKPDYFLVINGDVFTDYDYQKLVNRAVELSDPQLLQTKNKQASVKQAHLWLIDNPEHNLKGDFILKPSGELANLSSAQSTQTSQENQTDQESQAQAQQEQAIANSYTFSGIALYQPSFFESQQAQGEEQKQPLGPMLRAGIEQGIISAELLDDYWLDVGTPERLELLNNRIKGTS